jgi:nitroreductase
VDLFDAMHTQRAVRRFKPDAVPPEAVSRVLAAATRAPSGGNSQPWSFVVLRDAGVRRQVGALYKDAWDAGGVDRLTSDPDPAKARVYKSAKYLAERMGEAPVLILACIESGGRGPSLTTGASIYPAVQNLMLAARALGLGTVITTIHRGREREIKELLSIPEGVTTAALIPMGYPAEGAGFGPVRRRPISEVAYVDRWGQPLDVRDGGELP